VEDVVAVLIGVLAAVVLFSPVLFGLWKGRRAGMLAAVPTTAWRVALALGAFACVVAVVAFVVLVS
jgi:hypothetical protein